MPASWAHTSSLQSGEKINFYCLTPSPWHFCPAAPAEEHTYLCLHRWFWRPQWPQLCIKALGEPVAFGKVGPWTHSWNKWFWTSVLSLWMPDPSLALGSASHPPRHGLHSSTQTQFNLTPASFINSPASFMYQRGPCFFPLNFSHDLFLTVFFFFKPIWKNLIW